MDLNPGLGLLTPARISQEEIVMLSPGARETLRTIKTLSKRTGHSRIYQAALAEKLKCSVRTLKRWLQELHEAGLITRKLNQHQPAHYIPAKTKAPSWGMQ